MRTAALAALVANRPSVLSRLAEQLGWGLRQMAPTLVDRDCLRNAWNAFRWVDPNTLPDSAPAAKLCAEVHSFSRVFTGAFYELLSGMLNLGRAPTTADLLRVSADAGCLLADATTHAAVEPDYFAQVAAHMIDADTTRFRGKYRAVLTGTFVKRAILTAEVVRPLREWRGRGGRDAFGIAIVPKTPRERPRLHTVALRAREFGLGAGTLLVEAPLDANAFRIASASLAHRRADRVQRVEQATHRFVRMLFAHRRVDTGATRRGVRARRAETREQRRRTHAIVRTGRTLRLVRRKFDCGPGD